MGVTNSCSLALLLCATVLSTSASVNAGDFKGNVALKNNYVFSTGTKIAANPVAQLWLNKAFTNGLFLDLWSNMPLEDGNPSYAAEIDYKFGYAHSTRLGYFEYSLAYYDIQRTRVFDLEDDFYAPEMYWRNDHFNVRATYFGGESARDGFRVSLGHSKKLTERWALNTNINYANGPFAAQEAVIGKFNISYSAGARWLSRMSVELSEPLYLEDSNDRRDTDVTFALYYDF